MPYVTVAVEGYTDGEVARVVCCCVGLTLVRPPIVKRGKSHLDPMLEGYNRAAEKHKSLWLVLRDLNNDAECAPDLKVALLPNPSKFMNFRVVVRSIESWFMGDVDRLARFLSVRIDSIPPEPESLENPKGTMVELARKSKKRDIRYDMVPESGTHAKEGPAYASRLVEFAHDFWRPEVAMEKCDSLKRCIDYLEEAD